MKDEIEKRYYTILEVSNIFKIKTSTLRYWEIEFGELHHKRSKRTSNKKIGYRLYTDKNIIYIGKIYEFLKVQLYTIEGAKRQLELRGL